MFDSFLPFHLLTVKHEADPSFHVKTYIYRIKIPSCDYIVHLEEYTGNVFIIKFYPALLKRHPKKFQVIINKGVMRIVVGTMLQIMLHYFNANHDASFGFIASPSIIDSFTEIKDNNQRFRIYKRVMLDFFGNETFIHLKNESNSAYLMINKLKYDAKLVTDLKRRFTDIYPGIFDLEFTNS